MNSLSTKYVEDILLEANLLPIPLPRDLRGMVQLTQEQRTFLENHARDLLRKGQVIVKLREDQAEAKRERKARKRLRDETQD